MLQGIAPKRCKTVHGPIVGLRHPRLWQLYTCKAALDIPSQQLCEIRRIHSFLQVAAWDTSPLPIRIDAKLYESPRLVPKSSKQGRFHRRSSVSPLLYMMLVRIRQLLDDMTMQGRSPAGSIAWITRQIRMFHQRCTPSACNNDVKVEGVHHKPASNLSLADFSLSAMCQSPRSFCVT